VQDESLEELLPFGEYVPPEQAGSPGMLMGLDAYELDRLLTRLALHNAAAGGRRGRAGRHARAAARRGAAEAAAHQRHGSGGLEAEPAGQHGAPEQPGSAATPASRLAANAAQPMDAPEPTANGSTAREDYPASWPPHRGNHDGDYEASPLEKNSWDIMATLPSPDGIGARPCMEHLVCMLCHVLRWRRETCVWQPS